MKKNNKKIILLIFLLIICSVLIYIYASPQKQITGPAAESSSVTSENNSGITVLEINGIKYESNILGQVSFYDFMKKLQGEGKINFTEKDYAGMGKFIDSINGVKGNGDRSWIYFVNGKEAQVGVSNYKIKPGDVVAWKYEKSIY